MGQETSHFGGLPRELYFPKAKHAALRKDITLWAPPKCFCFNPSLSISVILDVPNWMVSSNLMVLFTALMTTTTFGNKTRNLDAKQSFGNRKMTLFLLLPSFCIELIIFPRSVNITLLLTGCLYALYKYMSKLDHLLLKFKGEVRSWSNLILEERVKFSEQNSENLTKIGWKIRKLWQFQVSQILTKHFLTRSIWICKWVSWWCHRLTTCHIFCT